MAGRKLRRPFRLSLVWVNSTLLATICAICKAQFTKVLPQYGFDMGMVGGVHQLVSKAILLDRAPAHPATRHSPQENANVSPQ